MTALLAADCHVHLFDPARFPYSEAARYLPGPHETATVEQLMAVLDAHAVSHALLVTPTSGYGSDNSANLAAIARHPQRLKGIAVVDGECETRDLAALKSAGMVGVRFDLGARGVGFLTGAGRRLVAELRRQEMVLDIQVKAELLDRACLDLLREEAGAVVFDHMAWPDPAAGIEQPGFAALLGLAACPNVAVKLSGPFRFSRAGFPYEDSDCFAKALIEAYGPERCVWGSDWPYVRMDHRVDYGPCLSALKRWLPDPAARRQVLWSAPSRLFSFEPLS